MERSTFIKEIKRIIEQRDMRAVVTPIFNTNDVMVDYVEPEYRDHRTFNCDSDSIEAVREFLLYCEAMHNN